MVLYHMWVIAFGPPEAIIFRGTHLLFAMVLVFLIYGTKVSEMRPIPTLLDYVWLVAGAASLLYLFVNYEYVVTRIYYIDDLPWADMIFGTILMRDRAEATRRCVDLSLPITAILFLLYGLFIARLEPMRILDQLYMTTEGIFGQALAVSASFVIIFVVFGSFMERTGVGQLFMDFAMALTGHTAGGPGKVSVVSSSPVRHDLRQRGRQRHGRRADLDPADEALGLSAAFRRRRRGHRLDRRPDHAADHGRGRLRDGRVPGRVPTAQVVIWAVIPAILYYVACFAAVHFEAKRRGILGVPRSELPRLRIVMAERGHLFLPILILLVVMYSGYSAPLAALAGTLACFPVAALRKSTRVTMSRCPTSSTPWWTAPGTRSPWRSPAPPPAS